MNQLTDQQIADRNTGVKMIIVASMLADYGGRMLIDGAKFALKNHVNGIINHAAGIERLFVTSRWIDENERANFRYQFCGNTGALIAEHLQNLFGLNEESLELVINEVNKMIVTKSPSSVGL
jgi:hypothetical protein